MGVPTAINERHLNELSAVRALAEMAKASVQTWCADRNYLFSSRVKSVESLSEKLESGRYGAWTSIDDRFACTVVVPTTTHEPEVIAFLDAVFERVELRTRNSTKKPPEVFRFDSTRWVGRLRPLVGEAVAPGAGAIQFEVQIQTVFEHAWGVVTHDLVYKSDSIDWRKARLAAQLKAAVEQIELTIAMFEASIEFMPQSEHPETDEKVQLVTELQRLVSEGRLTAELAPQSWSRLADNVNSLVRSYARRGSEPHALRRLRQDLVAFLETDDEFIDLRSGSLFQLILGFVGRGSVPHANLDNFTIVESSELKDFHGLANIPRPFDIGS